MKNIKSMDPADTIELGCKLGSMLNGGEIIRLVGDIGVGKTTFVRGMAAGIGTDDHASSPTFTAYKLYKGKMIVLYHYDFYRVQADKMIEYELNENLREDKAAVVLEWPEYIELTLPVPSIDIKFRVISESERELSVLIPDNFEYIDLA
jgi:tRNA threonylcarbamoyladenosine biosynthesis protein TsaE